MRIRDVQARAVVAPLEPPVRTASGHVTQAPLLLIDLTTDEGIVGRSYLFGYHAFTLAPLRELAVPDHPEQAMVQPGMGLLRLAE